MKRILVIVLFLMIVNFAYSQIIENGSIWKFLDDGSDQGTAWRNPDFDDSNWAEGTAKFGYGVDDLSTQLDYGGDASNKFITYYFRKNFNVNDTVQIDLLMLGLLRDDGAVVYINDTEVLRSNMPSGDIDYLTKASEAVYGESENIFFINQIPADILHDGENTIAVELHQVSKMSSDLAFDLKLDYGIYSAFRKAPYLLFPANNHEMLVMWQTDSTRNCLFEWGTDTTFSETPVPCTEYGNDHQFQVLLTDLIPGTEYFYKVSVNTLDSKEGSFNTAVEDYENKISFYAYGDTRSNPAIHDKVMEQMMSDMEQHPDMHTFVISTGDLVDDGDEEVNWDEEFFCPYFIHIQIMLANLPYVAAMGNHEGAGLLFKKYFPYPEFASNRYYYSFDYGPAHFTIIDQFTEYSPGSPQYEWLVNDLASTTKPWKFIILHEPGWSAGAHSNNQKVQSVIQPLCTEYKVQFVLAGHNHYYSRAVVDGIFHITTGGGGAPLYTPDANHPKIVKISKTNHFCKIEIEGDSLTFTAINKDGSIIETFRAGQIPNGVYENTDEKDNLFNVFSDENHIHVVNVMNYKGIITVFDDYGRVVSQRKLTGSENIISIYTQSIYFVRIDFEGKRIVKKVFVK